MLKIPDKSIDCVIIDPPYNLLKHKLDRAFNRELIYKELYRVLKNNSFLVVFGSGLQLCKDIVMLNKIGFQVKEECIWAKEKTSNPLQQFPRRHESFYILSKGEKLINKCYVDYFDNSLNNNSIYRLKQTYNRIRSALNNKEELEAIKKYLTEGIIEYDRLVKKQSISVSKNRKNCYVGVNYVKHLMIGNVENSILNVKTENYSYTHETQKPLELMSRIVKLVSNENDIILDCFAGSGSTLLGAIKNDRNYIGIEIDREYYNICCNRIKEKQGLFAGV